MSLVNPGLTVDPEQTVGNLKNDSRLLQEMKMLFGTADPVVQRAVIDFLKKNPGDLDHHNLRVIAAAGRSFDDKNHVAHMISKLPVTQMKIAAKPVEISTTSEQFAKVLRRFRPETARKLVLDLIDKSTLQVLEDSPPERVPEPGREIVRGHLMKMARGARNDRLAVVAHPHATAEIVAEVLDQIETGYEPRDPAELTYRLDVVRATIRSITNAGVDAFDEHNARQIWKILEPSFDFWRVRNILQDTLKDERFALTWAPQLFDLVDSTSDLVYEDERRLLRQLLAVSVPEQIAQQLVNEKRIDGGHPYGDNRLAVLRAHHYKTRADLLPPMTTSEIDMRVASLPASAIEVRLASLIEDPEALAVLASRVDELTHEVCQRFIRWRMQPEHVDVIIDRLNIRREEQPSYLWRFQEVKLLLTNKAVDDARLSELSQLAMARLGRSSEQRDEVLELAVCNPASGPLVWQLVKDEYMASERGIPIYVASCSASSYVQSQIAEIAIEQNDVYLARALASNGMLQVDVWNKLTGLVPDAESIEVRLFPPTRRIGDHNVTTYEFGDVVRLASMGLAPSNRVEAIRKRTAERNNNLGVSSGELGRLVLDAGLPVDNGLAAHPDRHTALFFATHPNWPSDRGEFHLHVETALAETAEAIELPEVSTPPDKGLRSWEQLPNKRDLPLPRNRLTRMLEGRTVDGLQLQMPKTGRELRAISGEMHNCLDGFFEAVTNGTNVVVYARDGDEIYAAMYEIQPQRGEKSSGVHLSEMSQYFTDDATAGLRLVEINSKFNQSRVPDHFTTALASTMEKLNNGELRRVEKPGPRVAVPQLVPGRSDRNGPDNAPNVLARQEMTEATDPVLDSEAVVMERQPEPQEPLGLGNLGVDPGL